MAGRRFTTQQLYALVVNEEDVRVCKEIDDNACKEVPGNFFRIMVSLILTKFGDLLISPKTVLAWLMGAIGVPAALIAWLVPIRESGSMIPQLLIAAAVRRRPRRSPLWVLGSVLQGICVAGMAATVWYLENDIAGYVILGLLILFSLSRGLSSVSIKDVLGKSIPKTRRGRLSGYSATFSGIATVVAGIWLFGNDTRPDREVYLILLVSGALLWFLAATVFSFVKEYDGETSGGGNAISEAFRSLHLLLDDIPFRKFVVSRALLMGSALSAPFFVVLAQRADAGNMQVLASFLFASSIASSLSASVWGWLADNSSRKVMLQGGGLAAVICLAVGVSGTLVGSASFPSWLLPIGYFVLSIAHSGVRIGRKTYIVDMAGGNKRTDYVAVSNTVIGFLLLLTGGLSAIASMISTEAVLIFLGLLGISGVISTYLLDEV